MKTGIQQVLKLGLVTHPQNIFAPNYLTLLEDVIEQISHLQLRVKSFTLAKEHAPRIKALAHKHNKIFLLNDFPELVTELEVDGVHLGPSDMSPTDARRIIGPNKIIGYSIETFKALEYANQTDAIDYVTASAVFPSKSKPDCKTHWGLDGFREVVERSRHPVTAIGGITFANARTIMEMGAAGVAVIGAIHDALDPRLAAQVLRSELDVPVKRFRPR